MFRIVHSYHLTDVRLAACVCLVKTQVTRMSYHQMPHEPTAAYPTVPIVPQTPDTYPHPDETWQYAPGYTPYEEPSCDLPTYPEQHNDQDGIRGIESTLDKMLHAKHKLLHPASHAKHKLKHSAVGKPVRIAQKIGRLLGRH